MVPALRLDIAQEYRCARAELVFGQRLLDELPRVVELRTQQRVLRQLAIVMSDFLEVRPLGQRLHALGGRNRFLPILLLLVDLEQESQRLNLERAAVEPGKKLLRSVEQACAGEILGQLAHRSLTLVRGKIRAA